MAFDWGFLDNAPQVQSEESEWEFRPADRFEAGLQETFGSLWGLASAAADTVGLEKARDWTANRAKELFQEAADKELVNVKFTEISDPIEAGQWVAQTAVDFLPSMIGGGGSGIATRFGLKALSGSPVVSKTVEHFAHKAFTKNLKELTQEAGEGFTKDQLYKAAIKKTAGDTGAMLGVAGFEGGQMAGQSYLYDYEKRGGDEANPAAAFATGAVGAALTLLSPVDRMLAGKLPTGKSIFATSFKEASQEVGQELTTIAHEAGIDPEITIGDLLSTEEGANRLLESGAAGALLGGIFGGSSRAYEKIYGQKEQAVKEDTPSTNWQDTLQAVREEQKKVLTERPEEILQSVGIDTSQDAKAPDINLQVPEVDTTSVAPEEPITALPRDIPTSVVEGDPQYLADTEVRRKIEAQKTIDEAFPPSAEEDFRDVSFTTNQEGTTLQRDIPVAEPVIDAQYNTDREVKRKIEAQKEIDKNFPPDSKESEVSKISTQIMQKQKEVNELQQVVKQTTNLKERNVATQKLNGAKSVLQNMKQQLSVVQSTPASPTLSKVQQTGKQDILKIKKSEAISPALGDNSKVEGEKVSWRDDKGTLRTGIIKKVRVVDTPTFSTWKDIRSELSKQASKEQIDGNKSLDWYSTRYDELLKKNETRLGIARKNDTVKETIYRVVEDGKDSRDTILVNSNKVISSPGVVVKMSDFKSKKESSPSLNPDSTVSPEQTVAYKREFLKRADSADKLLRVSEFADKHLGGAKAHSNIKNLIDHILSVAKKKLPNIKAVDVSESKGNIKTSPTGSLKAYYSKGKIYLDKEYFSTRKDSKGLEETIIHEVAHGLTVEEMEANPAIKKQVTDLLDTVRKDVLTLEELSLLESKYKFDPIRINQSREQFDKEFTRFSTEVYYGLLNEKEFLAQTFSSYEFQKALTGVRLEKPKGSIRTVWDKFVNLVREVLGLSNDSYTALDESLRLSTELMMQEGAVSTDSTVSPSLTTSTKLKQQRKSTKSWEDRAKEMRKTETTSGKVMSMVKDVVRDTVKSASEVLRRIDPKLLKPMRTFEMQIAESNVAARAKIQDFMDKYKKLSLDDRNLLWLTLSNTEPEYITKRNEILKKYKMEGSYSQVESLLKDIFQAKEQLGLNDYGAIEGYFPRRVKDLDGLIKKMKEDPEYNMIQAELDELEDKASQEDKEHLVKSLINTGRFPAIAFLKETSGKKRKILVVSSEWKNFYEDTPEALLNHIYENNELIAAHRMFSDNPNRNKLVKKRDSLYKKLENKELKDDAKKLAISEIESIESFLKDKEKSFDKLDAILVKEAPNMNPKDARLALNVIRARLTQKGMNGAWATLRNISLMSSLGSPTSAITQIGDFAFTVFRSGPKNTIRAMFGDRIIRAEDLDLEHSMKEFQTEGTAKWLDNILTLSGLKYMDLFAKNISINASLMRAKELKLKDFKKEYEYILGEDTERTYKDIQEGKNSELSRFFVFNELSDWQPISLMEMPTKYLTGGNGRIWYALKSYNIKALNNIYRESVYKWKSAKDNGERRTAAIQTGKLITMMVIAGASADELKDFLLGKSANSFSDNVHNNLLKIAFMSRYTLDQGFQKGFFETMIKDILIPPTGLVDDPLSDIYNTFKGDPDWKTVQNLPWGKLPYNWFADKPEESDNRKLKKRIVDGFKSGDSISKYSKEIREYNQWARRNKKEPITTKSLLQAKRRENK